MTNAPLHFTRTHRDDGLHLARASAGNWLIGQSRYRQDCPIDINYDSGNTGLSIRLTTQQARALAIELLALADLATASASAEE